MAAIASMTDELRIEIIIAFTDFSKSGRNSDYKRMMTAVLKFEK